MNYIIHSRVSEAKKLLTSTSESVQQVVAVKSGFSDPFHFSRTFKRHVGISPRLYVNLHSEQSRIAVYHPLQQLNEQDGNSHSFHLSRVRMSRRCHCMQGITCSSWLIVKPESCSIKCVRETSGEICLLFMQGASLS